MNLFKDDRGKSWFDVFPELNINGQVNYNISYPGTIKAFHRHKNQTDYFFCLDGNMRICLFTEEHGIDINYLSQGDLLKVDPGIWHGFQVLGNEPCKMLYYVTNKYDPSEPDEERADWDEFFSWEIDKK